ncbi:hypothetical protein M441DRAFT_102744, partial [Trichoderma asperellum CBS 433.97]
SALHYAVAESNVRLVQALIMRRAELNLQDQEGRTPLYEAASRNVANCLKLLINAGANINITDNSDISPLAAAAAQNHEHSIDLLLDLLSMILKAKPEAVRDIDEDGWTPLHWACRQKNSVDIIHILLDNGAEKNAATKRGWRPIDVAKYHG